MYFVIHTGGCDKVKASMCVFESVGSRDYQMSSTCGACSLLYRFHSTPELMTLVFFCALLEGSNLFHVSGSAYIYLTVLYTMMSICFLYMSISNRVVSTTQPHCIFHTSQDIGLIDQTSILCIICKTSKGAMTDHNRAVQSAGMSKKASSQSHGQHMVLS